jgi:hypothetical protein
MREIMKLTAPHPLHQRKSWLICFPVFCCLALSSCSENRRLAAELKELKTVEIELGTESSAASALATESYRKVKELEKSQQGDDRIVEEAEAKAEVLKKRIAYLQSAIKAANEQSDKLNTQTTQYKVKHLGN